MIGAALLLFTPAALAQPPLDADFEDEGKPPPLASGLQMSLKLEPALAVALSNPQAQMTDLGAGQTLKLMFGLSRSFSLGPSASFTTLPATPVMTDAGTAWTLGASARLMRPHDVAGGRRGAYAISPWLDGDLLYVRTGGLDRAGFAVAAGLAAPIDQRRRYWIGPFVRYFQILQGENAGFDNRDAKILSLGIGLEVGRGLERRRERVLYVAPAPAAVPVPVPAPSDRDSDGISDDTDQCPDLAGPAENTGCPVLERIAVKPDKLEVTDKIAFEFNSAKLEDSSYPALDEVARTLQANRGFRVQVDGHASSEGNEAHNQTLSEQRATAVLDYLIVRGVARERLVSKGFSSSVPIDTNLTVAGREHNRRVEFAVTLIILPESNTP